MIEPDVQLCEKAEIGDIRNNKYLYQKKFDGERVLIVKKGDELKLVNRRGNEKTKQFLEVVEDFNKILEKNSDIQECVIDGEVIIPTEDSPCGEFTKILQRNTDDKWRLKMLRKMYPAKFMAFDILDFNDNNLEDRDLKERLDVLKAKFPDLKHFQLVKTYEDKNKLWEEVKEKKLEGLVAKKEYSKYKGKRTKEWKKAKFWKEKEMEFTKWEENEKGIRLENEEGIACQVPRDVYEVKEILEKEGKVKIRIKYLNETENEKYRNIHYKELIE